MSSDAPLVLYGVFRQLLDNRVPLGVSDYLDAVRVLQWQAGTDEPSPFGDRDGLRRLCYHLWARSPDEIRLIDRIFEGIPLLTPAELAELAPAGDAITPSTIDDEPIPAPDQPDVVPESATTLGGEVERDARTAVSFEPPDGTGGLSLPYPMLPSVSETFVMQPQTVMSARALAVLWRRYRRMVRAGPRTELDLDGTAAEQVRRGVLDRPVLRPRRVNSAKLVILADASPSMSAWGPFLDELAASVVISRMQSIRLLYFANVPRRSVFASSALTAATPVQKVLDSCGGGGLMVISDAGAARGYLNRSRVTATQKFLAAANRRTRAIVWMNPTPKSRWGGTTAEAIAVGAGATFLPLDHSSMIRCVDILRGAKGR